MSKVWITRWFSGCRLYLISRGAWFKWWQWLCRILTSLTWICRGSCTQSLHVWRACVTAWIDRRECSRIRARIRSSPGTLLLPWYGCDEESWSARFWKRQIHTNYIGREWNARWNHWKQNLTVFQEGMMIRYNINFWWTKLMRFGCVWEIWMVSFNHSLGRQTIRWLNRLFIYSFSFFCFNRWINSYRDIRIRRTSPTNPVGD